MGQQFARGRMVERFHAHHMRHEGGMALRVSTAAWYAENAEALSLESSLRTVTAGYERPAGALDISFGS